MTPTAKPRYFWGVDCGSTAIKVALCDHQGRIVHLGQRKTLFPLFDHVVDALADPTFPLTPFERPPTEAIAVDPQHRVTATGYGRLRVGFAHYRLTEIKAHVLGTRHQLPGERSYTIVDIGGQDSKIVTVDDTRLGRFVINRKCAAGTGAFIEELAHRLEIPLGELTAIARRHDKELSLNSYCTVFAVQEMIRILVSGEKVENLIQALYRSVVKRVLEMCTIESDTIVFSGGVIVHHPILAELFGAQLPDKTLIVSPNAQYCGAIGAALHGRKKSAVN